MRRPVLLAALAALAAGGLSVTAPVGEAEAQTRASREGRTVVVITPRYLTAGTQVSPGERRGDVPAADARFRSTAYDLPGMTYGRYMWSDPFYLPGPHTTIEFDSPLGSKFPGER
jgi:hypothetical protein